LVSSSDSGEAKSKSAAAVSTSPLNYQPPFGQQNGQCPQLTVLYEPLSFWALGNSDVSFFGSVAFYGGLLIF